MKHYIKKYVLPAATLLAAAIVVPAQATVVTFNLGTVFSDGAVAPDGPPPYATVEFDDGGGTGTVTMTAQVSALVGGAEMTELYLNFDSAFDLGLLDFVYEAGSSDGPAADDPVLVGSDAYQSDGDGKYDIFFNFPTAMGSTFDGGETVVYTITSLDAITADSFNFLSAEGGGEGTYFAASKWQSTGPDGEDSAWVGGGGDPPSAIPVPAAVWLFASGLVGLVGIARRKRS